MRHVVPGIIVLLMPAMVMLVGCGPRQGAPDLDASLAAYDAGEATAAAPERSAGPSWLAMGSVLAAQVEAETPAAEAGEPAVTEFSLETPDALAETDALAGGGYVPWRQRVGPAYPGDPWRSFGRDVKELPATMWDDIKFTFTDPVVWVGLVGAGAAGIAINATGVDDAIDRRTDGHRHLNSEWDGVGGFFGSPAVHLPLAGLMYAGGLGFGDEKLYETSKTLLNALAINGATTLVLKLAARTESPNGDENGWPSGHTSSSFTLATVMYKTYGPLVGVPLFAFAGYVGYERIDARNHDFSDVISGMLIGIVIGHAVAENHDNRILGMELMPFVSPDGSAVGVALGRRF